MAVPEAFLPVTNTFHRLSGIFLTLNNLFLFSVEFALIDLSLSMFASFIVHICDTIYEMQ